MKSFVFLSVLCMLLLLGPVTAWSYDEGRLARRGIVARQDAAEAATTGDAATTAETASATDSTTTGTESESSKSDTATGTDTATKSDSSSSSTSIDPRMGAGGISMITPTQGATSYYKIGEKVTFAWNYTSLAVTPSAINVVASCSMNDATYTISNNMSVHETGKVTWDTGKYQANATVPLLTATYTLVVYDASKEIGDTASAGHLGSTNQFTFGMYVPKPYTPLNGMSSLTLGLIVESSTDQSEFNCATCNSALSELDKHALKFAMGMVTITVLSFTWFAGDFGVFAT